MLFVLQPGNDPYAFVEFAEHQAAAAALMAMNKRMCLGRVSRFECFMLMLFESAVSEACVRVCEYHRPCLREHTHVVRIAAWK